MSSREEAGDPGATLSSCGARSQWLGVSSGPRGMPAGSFWDPVRARARPVSLQRRGVAGGYQPQPVLPVLGPAAPVGLRPSLTMAVPFCAQCQGPCDFTARDGSHRRVSTANLSRASGWGCSSPFFFNFKVSFSIRHLKYQLLICES